MYLELKNEDYKIIMYVLYEKKFRVKNISPTLLHVVIILDREISLFYRLKNKIPASENLNASFKGVGYPLRYLRVSSH